MENETPLNRPVAELHGVGVERGLRLQRLGIQTIADLFSHQPRRHEDRKQLKPIRDLVFGESVTVSGKILAMGVKRTKRHSLFELILDDGTGRLHCRWWNAPYMEKFFKQGESLLVFGKIHPRRPLAIDHPDTENIGEEEGEVFIHLNRITPIYPLTEGITQRWIRSLLWRTLEQHASGIVEIHSISLPSWPSRQQAFRWLHFPEEPAQSEKARQRLALDEFIVLQTELRARRSRLATYGARQATKRFDFIPAFHKALPFRLTSAQQKVFGEISTELSGAIPMRRLLQGDVGSGKTVIAASAVLAVMETGQNALLMAPTEILAQQHFQKFRAWFEPLGIRVDLHTGSIKSEPGGPGLFDRSSLRMTIGTHALIESSFVPENIGLVIIDEQHKFGVVQRDKLLKKGFLPHLLVMTATPIPRTLSLTLYGDLDNSVIDELPKGRGKIRTFVRPPAKLPEIWTFLRKKLGEGRQAYAVCARVESDETLISVKREYERLKAHFAPFSVGMLHGGLASEEKDFVMRRFAAGQIHLLVATSVVEVGIDVANATVLVVQDADQFGLAQLHQLRGRVGRGSEESFCILVSGVETPETRQRLQIMEQSSDGFFIAEQDLKLRGPGEFLGQQQSGASSFKFADLRRDFELLKYARGLVFGA